MTIEISGDDFPTLGEIAAQIRDAIRDIDQGKHVGKLAVTI